MLAVCCSPVLVGSYISDRQGEARAAVLQSEPGGMSLSEQRALCLPLSDGVSSELSPDVISSCRRLLEMAWAEKE